MSRKWVEVQIQSSVDVGELVCGLDDPDLMGSWEENGVIRLYWSADRWSEQTLGQVSQMVRALRQDSECSLACHVVPEQDWNALWSASVKPVRVGRRVIVRPSWEQIAVEPNDIELVIDPKRAFGTGHHATTQLLIEWLEDAVTSGERVLDVGTGSGILAMAALRLGAASALGIDQDEAAIECAREYAVVNRFGSELELRLGSLRELSRAQEPVFDLILANLDRATFLECGGTLGHVAHENGRLLLSGILVEDQHEVACVFTRIGGVVTEARDRGGWAALEVVFPESCEA